MGGPAPWDRHSGQSILLPLRFSTLAFQMLCSIVANNEPRPYIMASLSIHDALLAQSQSPAGSSDAPTLSVYADAATTASTALSLSITCNIVELILIVMAYSSYKTGLQLFQGCLHFLGLLVIVMIMLGSGSYLWFWQVFLWFSLLPLLAQVWFDVAVFILRL